MIIFSPWPCNSNFFFVIEQYLPLMFRTFLKCSGNLPLNSLNSWHFQPFYMIKVCWFIGAKVTGMGREEIKNQIKAYLALTPCFFFLSSLWVVTLSSLEMLISVICWVTGKAATGIFLFEFKQTFFKMLRVLLGEIVSCQFNIYILFVAWLNGAKY